MKLTRREYDELIAVAIKAVKTIEPQLTQSHMQKLFARAYNKTRRTNNNEKNMEKRPVLKPGKI